jgi:acetyltransferase-like isoleucine patch superfamily enzyme
VIASPRLKVKLSKAPDAILEMHGNLIIRSDLGGELPVCIRIGQKGTLLIQGEFILGDGVTVSVGKGARLEIGGKKEESGSGITCDSKILVSKSIRIGTDVICAWHVLITDSDHHHIMGQSPQSPVVIGNHVWIATGALILKGCTIGDGSIVAARSVVQKQTFPPKCLIAGAPARAVRSEVEWTRDIPRENG